MDTVGAAWAVTGAGGRKKKRRRGEESGGRRVKSPWWVGQFGKKLFF